MDPSDGELQTSSSRFGLGRSLTFSSDFAALAALASFASLSCHAL